MSTHPVLPGLHRVMVAESFASRVGVYAGAAYGVSGAVLGPVDSHHRASGALVASVAVQPWLTLALRLDGRYDRHTDLPAAPPTMDGDSDDGWVGEPRLLARASRPLAPGWHAAAQLTMWLPGADAPSLVTSAATMDMLAGLSYRPPGSRLRVTVNAGLRLDNSAESVPDVNQLSQADRLSLGASDANALLLGVGASCGVGPVELLGEWTWDVLVGERAPRLGISPMRLAAGARAPLGTGLLGQVAIEVNIADPPVIVVDEPLAPFEPRLSVMAGVHYRFGEPDPRLQRPRRLDSGSAALGSLADKAPAMAKIPAPQPPALVPVRGQVVSGAGDADGAARAGVAGATVTLGDDERSVTTAADGRFELGELPPGSTRVRVTADGYEPAEQTVAVSAGEQRELSIVLEPMLPAGQLRGLVRSFRGQPLAATLTIEPTGPEVSTGPDGSFELDVAPGRYGVRIRAPGYREQRRKVNIEDGGVTILNVDLRRDR